MLLCVWVCVCVCECVCVFVCVCMLGRERGRGKEQGERERGVLARSYVFSSCCQDYHDFYIDQGNETNSFVIISLF